MDKNLRTEPKPEVKETYKVPEERGTGRPHKLGWFERLNTEEGEKLRLGERPPGKIIQDDA